MAVAIAIPADGPSFGVAASDVVHTRAMTRHFPAPIDMAGLNAAIQEIETELMRF